MGEWRMPTGLLRWLAAALLVAAITIPAVVWRVELAALFANRGTVVDLIRSAGIYGPLLLVGLVVAQVVAAPIPGQAVNFVAGYLYGFWAGTAIGWAGLILGSALAMGLARLFGRPIVCRFVAPAALDRLDRLAQGQGLVFFFLIWMLPFLPDDLACFVAGLTPLPLRALIVTAAVGRLPGIMVSTWLGANAEQLTWQVWLVVGIASLAALLLAWRYGPRLQNAFLGSARTR